MKYIGNKNMVDDKKTLSGGNSFLTFEAFKYNQVGNLK
jgi:hypothetical protein